MESRPGCLAGDGQQVSNLCTTCDLLSDVRLEESVLSTMFGGVKVRSLPVEAFTSPLRQRIYLLLCSGVPYENLEAELRRDGLSDDGYLADVFLTPLLPHTPLLEAIEELKRLALIRPLHGAVEAWLRRMPTMTHRKAMLDLGRVIRGERFKSPPPDATGSELPSQAPKFSP